MGDRTDPIYLQQTDILIATYERLAGMSHIFLGYSCATHNPKACRWQISSIARRRSWAPDPEGMMPYSGHPGSHWHRPE
jgi:hypothetical protein